MHLDEIWKQSYQRKIASGSQQWFWFCWLSDCLFWLRFVCLILPTNLIKYTCKQVTCIANFKSWFNLYYELLATWFHEFPIFNSQFLIPNFLMNRKEYDWLKILRLLQMGGKIRTKSVGSICCSLDATAKTFVWNKKQIRSLGFTKNFYSLFLDLGTTIHQLLFLLPKSATQCKFCPV